MEDPRKFFRVIKIAQYKKLREASELVEISNKAPRGLQLSVEFDTRTLNGIVCAKLLARGWGCCGVSVGCCTRSGDAPRPSHLGDTGSTPLSLFLRAAN